MMLCSAHPASLCFHPCRKPRPRNYTWAELMKRVFDLELLRCPCGGSRRLLAVITQPHAIVAILCCLDLLPSANARAPRDASLRPSGAVAPPGKVATVLRGLQVALVCPILARGAMNQGRFKLALALCRDALRAHPENLDAWKIAAEAMLRLGSVTEGRRLLARYRAVCDSDPELRDLEAIPSPSRELLSCTSGTR